MNKTKTCTGCGETKPLDKFYKKKRGKDGRDSRCIVCCRTLSQEWSDKNREKKREYAREYARNNLDERRETQREWRKKNPDKVKGYKKRYYEKNRTAILASQAAYNKTDRAKELRAIGDARRIADGTTRSYRLARMYGITVDEFEEMVNKLGGLCPICHLKPKTWHIDHDHSCCPGERSCGKCIRGLLCIDCNVGMGRFSDDPERLRAAARYLIKFQKKRQNSSRA